VYEVYSHCYGIEQSLEELARRHGFGTKEVEVFLRARQEPKDRWRELVQQAWGGK